MVKGVNFVDLRDAGDPVEAARAYDAAGADELCFLDIAASQENRGTLLDLASRTAEQCFMPLTVGGGVRTRRGRAGAAARRRRQGGFNTAAVANPEVISAAAEQVRRPVHRRRDRRQAASAPGRWEIFTHGGTRPTGIDAVGFAREMAAARRGRDPADLDGPRRHPRRLRPGADPRRSPTPSAIPVIASRRRRHARASGRGRRREGHASAVLAASIFHFGQHSIAEAKAAMAAAGIPVRPT